MLILADSWKDYELIDMGNGEKLERWGDIVLRRPDPQVVWPMEKEWSLWKNPHGHYHRSNRGGGSWEQKKKYPESWTINYKNLKFNIRPTGFKHTGLFPEQAANWDWMIDKIKKAKRPIKVLNLFAYTGGATVACASAGAEVCHVDAAKGMGMTTIQIFTKVELPIILPVILSGIRVSLTATILGVTIGSYIGYGGLGKFILQGLNGFAIDIVMLGTIPIMGMVLLFDFTLKKVVLIIEMFRKAKGAVKI